MNILFTCAGRRRYLLKYFKEVVGEKGKIVATDMQLTAPALTAADVKIQVPAVYAPDYIDVTLEICKKHDIQILISLNDLELPILSDNKYRTYQFIKGLGLESPKTFINYEEAVKALEDGELQFPLILKPRWGSGSIGLEFVDDMEELEAVYKLLQKKIKKSILAKASAASEYILIQQVINGPEYGLDITNDLNGVHRGVSVKQKLAMRSGETDKAITVDNLILRQIGKTIGENLKHIANLDCDILEKDGTYYVLELNPRFGGGYPFSHEAGVNTPKAIVEWAKGNDVDNSIFFPQYGKMYSKCDILLNVGDMSK